MSRIGQNPITIPSGVEVKINDLTVVVKGSKGSLTMSLHPRMKVTIDDKTITVERAGEEILDRSLHGLTRTLIANMIHGVANGFSKQLEIQGVGYRAEVQGNKIKFALGYSHPVEFTAPEGITFEMEKDKKNIILITGIDKQLVGQVAANIRALRPPEPYKGKGIRYVGEVVKRKAGKAAAAGAKGG